MKLTGLLKITKARAGLVGLTFLCAVVMKAQCPVTAFGSPLTINCGDTAVLGALATGCTPLNNNFNGCTIGSWSVSPGAAVTNGTGTYACAGPSPEGPCYLWMGATIAAPRGVTTNNYDLTQCGATSGTICFDMKYSTQAGPNPCEGIDLPAEGVYIQYSTNNGATWTNIQYYNPNGGYDPVMTSWNRYCLVIPPGAFTTSTCFRWYQSQSSGVGYDTWGLDDMVITLNSPGFTYDWAHDMLGPSASAYTPPVAPTSTTTYTVTYTNGTPGNTCTAAVTINVAAPTVTATATPVTLCSGNSSQLVANSSLVSTPVTSCGLNAGAACPPNSVSDEKTVGVGTTTVSYNGGTDNVWGNYGDAYQTAQLLFRASELTAAGMVAGQINSLTFDVQRIQTSGGATAGSVVYPNVRIGITCTNVNTLSTLVTGINQVYSGTNVTISTGLNPIFFSQSYNWDGVSNIVVQVCWYFTNGAGSQDAAPNGTGNYYAFLRHNNPGFACYRYSGTNFSPGTCGTNDFVAYNSYRPNLTFGFCKPKNLPLTYTWTPSTGLSSTSIFNPVASPTATTTYSVTVQQTGAPAICAAQAVVTVNVVNPYVTVLNGGCSAGSQTLVASGSTNGTYAGGVVTVDNCTPSTNDNNTFTTRCVQVSNISPNAYPGALASAFANITGCAANEVQIQIQGPGMGGWTPLTFTALGGQTWASPLPAGAGTPVAGSNVNGQWCIQWRDIDQGLISNCGAHTLNCWGLNFNQGAGSNNVIEYSWASASNLNTTSGSTVVATTTAAVTYTVTITDANGCTAYETVTVNGCSMVLPVELLNFEGTKLDNSVILNWVTASEKNSDYFLIERSADGENFFPIGQVKAAGSSFSEKKYDFTDYEPRSPVSYYRLRQTDLNGDFENSKVIVINNVGAGAGLPFPNPATNQIFIPVTDEANNAILKIFSMDGNVCYDGLITVPEDHLIKIDLSEFRQGVFFTNIILTNGKALTSKFIKK